MKLTKVLVSAAFAVALGSLAMPAAAGTVTIPDVAPGSDVYYGTGDASVIYSDVTFSQSSALSNGNLFNVGSNYYLSNPEAVLSSQQQTDGVANILISLPSATDTFSVDYGTFQGSDVTFLLSNGDSFSQGSTADDYTLTDLFSVDSTPFTSVLITSPDFVLSINNIAFGVPEPATWAMMLMGVCLVGGGLRMARRKSDIVLTAA